MKIEKVVEAFRTQKLEFFCGHARQPFVREVRCLSMFVASYISAETALDSWFYWRNAKNES